MSSNTPSSPPAAQQQQQQQQQPQILSTFTIVDLQASYLHRIAHLETELARVTKEKDELWNKHSEAIDRLEALHANQIEAMRKEIEGLEAKVNELEVQLKGYKELRDKVTSLEAKEKRREDQHRRLLCGSIAYVYIKSAVSFVFRDRNRREIQQKLRDISNIDDLEAEVEENSDDAETRRFSEFKHDCYKEKECNLAVQHLSKGQVNIAHPIKEEGKKSLPDTHRMKEIVAETYRSEEIKNSATDLIDCLVILRDKLGKKNCLLELF